MNTQKAQKMVSSYQPNLVFAMSIGVPHMHVVTLNLTYLPICQARIHAEEDQVALVT